MGSNFTVPLATSLWNPSHRSDERSATVAKPSQAAFAHPLLLSPPGCSWVFAVGDQQNANSGNRGALGARDGDCKMKNRSPSDKPKRKPLKMSKPRLKPF